MKQKANILFILAVIFMAGYSCSRKKNSFTRRAYHETTSHYNYYFNARELLKTHLLNIQNSYTDDYNYILPIFYYGTEAQATGAYDDMESIIKKCSKLIERHSMYIQKDEFNKWIDETYILVGKAKFYKREFYGAIEVFEYVTYAFADKPAYFEAKIWLARTYLEMEDQRSAEDLLESIKDVSVPEKLKWEYYALYADLNFKKGDLEQAAFYLRESIKSPQKRDTRRRYTYILAQIFHELKVYAEATVYYGKVLKMRPDYIMAFNAKLNQARAYDVSANNSDDIKKRLNRMLKDKKNYEFRDQIYFALAELAFRENDQALGMEYLQKCTAASMGNNKIKSEAYMLLGDIFYDKPEYIIAHGYYDSCVTIMPESHIKYELIKERKESLDDLVENLIDIDHQDSLQMVASMDEKERKKLINGLIKEVERQEERERIDLARSFADSYEFANKRENQMVTGAKWYFYNQSVKSFGVSDFNKTWGSRIYEDNWRRSDKSKMVEFSSGEVDSVDTVDSTQNGLTNKDEEFYLNQLPLTDSALAVSHNKIIFALYSAGNIFREEFMDYSSALECFNRLVTDYDTCQYVESSYYQMYRIYLLMEEYSKAEEYKNLILNKYPFSEYARIIKNPEYLKNKRDRKEQIEAYYGAAYKLYGYRMYNDVIDASAKADSLFGDHHMKPQFDYLRALAIGKQRSKQEFKEALQEIVAKYPTDEVGKAAQKILDKMDEVVVQKEKREAIYKTNFRDEHIFVVMSPNLSNVLDDIKTAISNYNVNSYGAGNLKVSSVVFDGPNQMISVKSFKDKDEGLRYMSEISLNPEFKSKVIDSKFEHFLISIENFAYFYQQKNLEEYLTFYGDHYR